MEYHRPSTFFRLLFADDRVIIRARIRGAGLLVDCLSGCSPATRPSNSTKEHPLIHEYSFRCGSHVAHSQPDAATTTAGRQPTRQCFAVWKTQSEDWPYYGLRVLGRIDKKLTKAKASNRPERRVPEAKGDRPGLFALETMVSVSFAQTPSQACKGKQEHQEREGQ